MSSLLIRGGRVVDPESGRDLDCDVLIRDGVIEAIGPNLDVADVETLDAGGKIVAPGFVDLRSRLREPGLEHAETIETGSRAAAAGGFATVCTLPTTIPFNDSATVTSFIRQQGEQKGAVRVLPIGGLTKEGKGEQIAELGSMKAAGAIAVGNGDRTVMDTGVMRRAMKYAASFGLTVVSHCEDLYLSAGGDIHEGAVAARLGLSGIPASAETVVLARDLLLSRELVARAHFAHLSAAESVETVRRAKADGAPVTAEVAAHQLVLTADDIPGYDSNYKLRPPLREAGDREALIQGIADGAIDAVVSDHSPHTGNVKMQEFERCPFGMTGFETAVGLAIEVLLRPKRVSLMRFVEVFTLGPARAFGIVGGRLSEGAPGDVTIIDLEREWTFQAEQSESRSRNTPFDGREFVGGPAATVVGGKVVWRC